MIVKPLTALTKQNGFLWSKEAQAAFDRLKSTMPSYPFWLFLTFPRNLSWKLMPQVRGWVLSCHRVASQLPFSVKLCPHEPKENLSMNGN